MLGSDSATAIEPTEPVLKSRSDTGAQETPAFTVFKTPPPAAPMEEVSRSLGIPSTAVTRPPRSGPIDRQRSACAAVRGSCAPAAVHNASTQQAAENEIRFMAPPLQP